MPPLMIEMGYSHYRISFRRWPMYIPLLYPPLFAAAGFLLLATSAPWAKAAFGWASAGLVVMGLAGGAWHAQGILRRPGGWTLKNVMFGAPLFAPLSFAMLGALGLVAVLYWP